MAAPTQQLIELNENIAFSICGLAQHELPARNEVSTPNTTEAEHRQGHQLVTGMAFENLNVLAIRAHLQPGPDPKPGLKESAVRVSFEGSPCDGQVRYLR
jgi:hypothetical protein